ncbi:hypothetical protein PGT21_012036 [Puccinia graminis f. sp. tritici]|uniref:Uncharacterized protein n=1 Tax=Puccinia graminis f. sp. tritici TaxID=56615 RepID=A0A5B0NL95_PUCGR|nr:hypothetical protein PGT21_012036 [Puccinia graminis f. sp. tritici]
MSLQLMRNTTFPYASRISNRSFIAYQRSTIRLTHALNPTEGCSRSDTYAFMRAVNTLGVCDRGHGRSLTVCQILKALASDAWWESLPIIHVDLFPSHFLADLAHTVTHPLLALVQVLEIPPSALPLMKVLQ